MLFWNYLYNDYTNASSNILPFLFLSHFLYIIKAKYSITKENEAIKLINNNVDYKLDLAIFIDDKK